jgi:predicted ATPase
VLILEDVQWSDASTVEWLATMARRREPARLCILGTYRPTEVLADRHPLSTLLPELRAHGQCRELAVTGLGKAAIETYVAERFADSVLPERLTDILVERTEGNPLFLVNVLDELVAKEVLIKERENWQLQLPLAELPAGVPTTLRQLLQNQMDRLDRPASRILEAGSVAGAEFSAATVAAALQIAVDEVEEQTEVLVAREQFLRRAGMSSWPDGTEAARYGFRHAFYQQLWHERVPVTRRWQWHQRMGECLEAAYGEHVREIAPEIVIHFQEGRDTERTGQYLRHAGEQALQRRGYHEAIGHLTRSLEELQALPETPYRLEQEVQTQLMISLPKHIFSGRWRLHDSSRQNCGNCGRQ